MQRPNQSVNTFNSALAKLQKLLEKVKKTVQSKADLKYLQKYLCGFEISQPQLLVGGELKKYQLESLEWMVNLAAQNSNGILADDMGLGKTIQGIAYLAYLKETHGIQGKHLVVCPKSVAGNWMREINKWFPSANAVLMIINQQTCDQFMQKVLRPKKFDIIITNFEAAKNYASPLSRIKWQTMIIDQAHKIKNHESKNFQILNKFSTTFRLLLTGTPLNNNLKELWALLNFIMPELFRDEDLFNQIEESTNALEGTDDDKLKYQCQVAKCFHQIIRPFFKRRTKKELDLGLPEKIEMTLFVPLSKLQLRIYRNYLRHGNVEGDPYSPGSLHIMTPRKICQHPFLFSSVANEFQSYQQNLVQTSGKLNVLDKLLKKLIAQKHKILLFSQFVIMLDILEDYCRMKEYKFCRIDGDTELQDRDKNVRKFYDDSSYSIFLLSTKAGGLGLNLVAADCVIIYDIDWNPQNDLQAADRAYRIGQTRTVLVYKLITEHSIQERMLELQKYKLIWDELVIQRGAIFGRIKDDPLANINFNQLSKLGKGDIFHLQPDENDQTIQQILALGKEKNMQKQVEIRQKLKKTIEAGSKLNPFEGLQQQEVPNDTEGDEDRFVYRRNYDNQKRQRSKFDRSRILPAFKFYLQPQLIKDIEFQIHMETKRQPQKQDKKLLQILYEKLQEAQNKGRFHFWNQLQFQLFIRAHQKYHSKEYSLIAEFIQSKTTKEVAEYSQHFFQKAPNNQRLIPHLRQIQKFQSLLKKLYKETSKQSVVKHTSESMASSSVNNQKKGNQQNYSESSEKTHNKKQSQKQKKAKQKEKIKAEKEEAKRQEKEAKQKKREEDILRRAQAKLKRQAELKQRQQAKRLKQEEKARLNSERQEKKLKQQLQREKKKLQLEIKKQQEQVEKLIKQNEKPKKKKSKTQKKESETDDKSSQKTHKEENKQKERKLSIVQLQSV